MEFHHIGVATYDIEKRRAKDTFETLAEKTGEYIDVIAESVSEGIEQVEETIQRDVEAAKEVKEEFKDNISSLR